MQRGLALCWNVRAAGADQVECCPLSLGLASRFSSGCEGRTQPWCLAWGDPHRSRTKRQGSVRTAEPSETPTCILLPPQVHKCTRRFGRFLSPLCTSGCAPPGSGMRDDQDGDCPGHCVNTLPPGENEQYAGSETVRLSRERVCRACGVKQGRFVKVTNFQS